MYTVLYRIKYACVGNVFRIIRLILSFLPIIGYVLPIASLEIITKESEISAGSLSMITLFTNKSIDLGSLFDLFSKNSVLGLYGVLALAFFFASLALGVVAFFLIPIVNKKVKSPLHAVLHLISMVLYFLAPFMLSKFCSALTASGIEASCETKFGIYIGAALFFAAAIADIIAITRPFDENDNKYIPNDELQKEYAISIGAMSKDG